MAGQGNWESSWTRLQKDWPNNPNVTTDTILRKYDAYKDYDNDMEILGYQGADVLARKLSKTDLPKDSLILDVGCGTGLVGIKLKDCGFTNLQGHDGSAEMLKEAEKSNVYKHLFCCFLGNGHKLPAKTGTYDAIVMAGGASPGHFTIDAFEDMLRTVKIGGMFAHTCRESNLHKVQHSGLLEYFRQKVDQGILEAELDEIYDHYYRNTNGTPIPGRIQIFKLLKQTSFTVENGDMI